MVFPRSGHLGESGGMPPQKILKFEAVLGAFWGHLRQLCQLTTLHFDTTRSLSNLAQWGNIEIVIPYSAHYWL